MHDRVLNDVKRILLAALLATAVAMPAQAQKKDDPGATDTEIKVGNIMPYSGPASAYATIGKTGQDRSRLLAGTCRPHLISRSSTPKAESTAARSTSPPMTTARVRQGRGAGPQGGYKRPSANAFGRAAYVTHSGTPFAIVR
jgi:hypothetical protein